MGLTRRLTHQAVTTTQLVWLKFVPGNSDNMERFNIPPDNTRLTFLSIDLFQGSSGEVRDRSISIGLY